MSNKPISSHTVSLDVLQDSLEVHVAIEIGIHGDTGKIHGDMGDVGVSRGDVGDAGLDGTGVVQGSGKRTQGGEGGNESRGSVGEKEPTGVDRLLRSLG